MSASLRFGLIGVDSPHAPSFTRLLTDGATITHAWKGEASPDFPLSYERIDAFAEEVAGLGVRMCESPDEVAEGCDALLIVASDARTHPALFHRVAPHGKPVYVDTRFALTTEDARSMLAASREHGCLPLAGSPKRFAAPFRAALEAGPVERIDLTGALPTQPGHPGLAWYGVHLVDLAVAALGPGCVSVSLSESGRITLTWADGRVATLGGEPEWSPLTTGVLTGPDGVREFVVEAGPPMLTGLLSAIVAACRSGEPTVPEAEILDVVAVVEASAGRL